MSKVAYETLEVYQLAFDLAQRVYVLVRPWDPFDRETVGKQLVRAADSVGANIAEGFGRGNGADHKRFLRIARGSASEAIHWLRLAFTRGLVAEEVVLRIKPLLEKLPPKLNAYMNAVTRTRQSTIDNPQSKQ
jgi:four helix bundle protein